MLHVVFPGLIPMLAEQDDEREPEQAATNAPENNPPGL